MPAISYPVDPWDVDPYVVGTEDGKPSACCGHVGGLDAVMAATEEARRIGPGVHIPNILLAGIDAEGRRWVESWGSNATNLIVHDVRRKRWFLLHRAWICATRGNPESYEVSVDYGELVAAPEDYLGPN